MIPLIPLRHFFDNPEKVFAKLSPDGSLVAYVAPENGILNVWVKTVGLDDDRPVTHDRQRPIINYFWSRDSKRILYLQDKEGNENTHIFAADPAQPDIEAKNLTPFDGVKVNIIDVPRETPDQVLVSMNKRNPMLFDVHRLDLTSGELDLIAENPGNIVAWITDAESRLRGAVAQTGEGDSEVLFRDTEDQPFRSLAVYDNEDEAFAYTFTKDGTAIYLRTARDAEFQRLVALDIATGEQTVIDSDEESDLVAPIISDKTKELQGALYRRDRLVLHAFDERLERDWKLLTEVHSGDPEITSSDEDETKWIVTFNDERDPGATYLFDRNTAKSEFLFRARPWLNPDHLAAMEPVKVKSRDGWILHSYLTVPPETERKNLPMILLVHGGPWYRDVWGWNPEVQFFANRGYAVLQVNYRGSTGYGKAFQHAAEREYAGKMHDDLIDGVNWAISEGLADPDRIGIYGRSYGGYAALVGVTFTPDVFKAAVSYCGPSNLITHIKSLPAYWSPDLKGWWFRYIGDPDDPEQLEDLKARSPTYKVDQIKTPLLVIQGANDPRVKKAESDQIVEALRKRGVDVEYLVKDDEGHGFLNADNRMDAYAAMERFFAKHLGGRSE